MEAAEITRQTFVEEAPNPSDTQSLMIPGKQLYSTFKTFRDSAVFTNKRLIVQDRTGLSTNAYNNEDIKRALRKTGYVGSRSV